VTRSYVRLRTLLASAAVGAGLARTGGAGIALTGGAGLALTGCASGSFGESYAWKRPCGTEAQREADSQACLAKAAGIADPSGGREVEYAQDLFNECMMSRGWQRLPADTALACK